MLPSEPTSYLDTQFNGIFFTSGKNVQALTISCQWTKLEGAASAFMCTQEEMKSLQYRTVEKHKKEHALKDWQLKSHLGSTLV